MKAKDCPVLLYEGIHKSGVELFKEHGFDVSTPSGAVDAAAQEKELSKARFLGIRSLSKITPEVMEKMPQLLGVGCYGIGTNQVDLKTAAKRGVVVFNAPYASTRSVAELVFGEIIMLLRRTFEKSMQMHQGTWNKSSAGCYEVRGKTLGIVGYGHISSQLSIMAESLGMNVIFYDTRRVLSMGSATPVKTLQDLLKKSDAVTLHVPAIPETKNMIGASELALMKKGAVLINAARGSVVDIDALAESLKSGHLGGAALDVFPKEPSKNTENFESPVLGLPNVILTPHLGGSTAEAQARIGVDVSEKLAHYFETGSTAGAVNFPEIIVPPVPAKAVRLSHIHRNIPGVLAAINQALSARKMNIAGQYLRTDAQIGYVILDIDAPLVDQDKFFAELCAIEGTIKVRLF